VNPIQYWTVGSVTVLVIVGTDWAEEGYGAGGGGQQCDSDGNCGYRLG
jgi:hypothetical protein